MTEGLYGFTDHSSHFKLELSVRELNKFNFKPRLTYAQSKDRRKQNFWYASDSAGRTSRIF